MRRDYAPDSGHLIWVGFDPQAGREQAGRRPALVLSPAAYNSASGLCLACPITTKAKGYPFEVALAAGAPIAGVILADHLKSLDWRARRAEPAGAVSAEVLRDVIARIAPLFGLE